MDIQKIDLWSSDQKALKQLGCRIRLAREAKALSLAKASKKANISMQFLGQVEKGRQTMSSIKLSRLAQVMGVSTDYLIFGYLGCSDEVALAVHLQRTMEMQSQSVVQKLRLIDRTWILRW